MINISCKKNYSSYNIHQSWYKFYNLIYEEYDDVQIKIIKKQEIIISVEILILYFNPFLNEYGLIVEKSLLSANINPESKF